VVNALDRENVYAYGYDYTANPPVRRTIGQFPLLPTGGVRVEF
jgi:hypothetical protein